MQSRPMSKIYSYFPLYAAEFVAETGGMSAQERSAYILLLCHAWLNSSKGELPADDESLAYYAQLSVEDWVAIKKKVLRSFECSTERVRKISLTEQWQHCQVLSQTRKRAVDARESKKITKGAINVGTEDEPNVIE